MKEYHHILKAGSVPELMRAQQDLLSSERRTAEVVFKRYFLSDAIAQRPLFPEEQGAVAYIQQPPLDGSSVAVWLYLVDGVEEVRRAPGVSFVRAGGLTHVWTAGITAGGSGSEEQTRRILENYDGSLKELGIDMAGSCARTWFFCHDIDNLYAGLVKGRREYFDTVGLVPDTHYIASTGIAGTPPAPGALVQMDAYSVMGDIRHQYLYAPANLNPTYEYGVTFERGVRLDYDGRRHLLISGTASIDNRGQVVHVGDVVAQTRRMWDNVEALLEEGGAGMEDICQMLVYLRNAEDYARVAPMFAEKFPGVSYVILLAPVCRPDWLIEMECIAAR